MGCSSGQLQLNGDFESSGMAAAYMTAGCPALVANLWDVTDKDIDRLTEKMISAMVKSPKDTLLGALTSSRGACVFRSLTGCAPVYYGVPIGRSTGP